MALRLTIVSRNGAKIGTSSVKEFGPGGGTIGRSLECDWVLPDTKRYLSSRHASIDFRSGSYYIVDTSMNGVYVNDAEQPVGRGKPQRLFDGDRLRIGDYEISVEVDDDPISPLIEENHVDPVDLAQRVEAPEPTGNDMVDAYEITGVGIEMMLTDDELETLSPPPKSKGGYFEIVEGDAPVRESNPRPAAAVSFPAKANARTDGLELADATQPALLAPRRPAARPAAGTKTASPKPAAASSTGAKAAAAPAAPAAPPAQTGARSPSAATTTAAAQPPAGAARLPAGAQRSPAPRSPAAAPQPSATAQKPSAAAQPPAATPAAARQPVMSAAARQPATSAQPSAQPAGAVRRSSQAPLATGARSPQPGAAGSVSAAPSPSPQMKTAPVAAEQTFAAKDGAAETPAAPSAADVLFTGGAPAQQPVVSPTPLHARADLESFFRGAGLSARVSPQQADAFLFRLGQVMRTMVAGLTESLHLRAEQKNALRLPSTTIQPQDNNPLKLSAGVDEAFVNLLLRESPAHLSPVDAVREAFDDLQLHQQILLKAMRAALEAFVSRLDPDELESKFARGRSNMLVNAANRLKYWDLYKDLYDVVAHHPPGELPMQFLEDFAQAYEQELEHESDAPEAAVPAAQRQAV